MGYAKRWHGAPRVTSGSAGTKCVAKVSQPPTPMAYVDDKKWLTEPTPCVGHIPYILPLRVSHRIGPAQRCRAGCQFPSNPVPFRVSYELSDVGRTLCN